MKVTLKFKQANGKVFKISKTMTCKQARRVFKKKYLDDDNIIKVWLTYFDGWHEVCHDVLKDNSEQDMP